MKTNSSLLILVLYITKQYDRVNRVNSTAMEIYLYVSFNINNILST